MNGASVRGTAANAPIEILGVQIYTNGSDEPELHAAKARVAVAYRKHRAIVENRRLQLGLRLQCYDRTVTAAALANGGMMHSTQRQLKAVDAEQRRQLLRIHGLRKPASE